MRILKFAALGAAVAAGILAFFLVQGELDRKRNAASMVRPAVVEKPKAEPKIQVLVAAARLKRGHILRSSDFEWRSWPRDAIGESFLTRSGSSSTPDAVRKLTGAVVRSTLSKGEPIFADKVIDLNHPGAVSAMLRSGMLGYAIKFSPETGAGGFIVPGNYVDVVLTRTNDVEYVDAKGRERVKKDVLFTDTLVRTARVIAVDTELDADGKAALPAERTVTLELFPNQVELLAMAEEAGRLTVALRSIAELVDENGVRIADPLPTIAIDPSSYSAATLGAWNRAGGTAGGPGHDNLKRNGAGSLPIGGASVRPTTAPADEITILRHTTISRTSVPKENQPANDAR